MTQIIWSDHPMAGLIAPFIAYGARCSRAAPRPLPREAKGLSHDPTFLWIDD
jgi:hypothetical protein